MDEALQTALRQLLGLDDDHNAIVGRLDRLERALNRLNITPAELETLEKAVVSLEKTDQTIDAIEPEGATP